MNFCGLLLHFSYSCTLKTREKVNNSFLLWVRSTFVKNRKNSRNLLFLYTLQCLFSMCSIIYATCFCDIIMKLFSTNYYCRTRLDCLQWKTDRNTQTLVHLNPKVKTHIWRATCKSTLTNTLGPPYYQFGYCEHPVITIRFYSLKWTLLININV